MFIRFSDHIEEKLLNDDKSLFVLCWSENAAKSDYVEKERQEALALAYPQSKSRERARLRIHPYNIEPRVSTNQLSVYLTDERFTFKLLPVIDIVRGEHEVQKFTLLITDEMQLEGSVPTSVSSVY